MQNDLENARKEAMIKQNESSSIDEINQKACIENLSITSEIHSVMSLGITELAKVVKEVIKMSPDMDKIKKACEKVNATTPLQ